MTIIIEDASKWKTDLLMSLDLLNKMCTPARESMNSEVGLRDGTLNRKVQEQEWKLNDYQRVKEYLHSLLKGNADVDFFMFVPIELIIISLETKVRDASTPAEKNNIQAVLTKVKEDFENGTIFYTVDGQNRLFKAIVRFFKSKIPFGVEKLIAIDTNTTPNTRISLSGKKFEDVPKIVQEFIKKIEVPVAIAEKGDIDTFTDALIAKNTNVSWNDWQKLRTRNCFTEHNRKILEIFEKDGLLADNIFHNLGSGYKLEKDGYEKFISEMLIWMDSKIQPKKDSNIGHIKYFQGIDGFIISEKNVQLLKKYLREFAKIVSSKKKYNSMMVRNYVMFRYALDQPKEFKNIDIPYWKINKATEFVAQFILADAYLKKEPGAHVTIPHPIDPKKSKKEKVPYYMPWALTEYSSSYIETRLRKFSEYLQSKKEQLITEEVIVELDSSKMPSIEDLYLDNPHDYKGRKITGTEIVKKKYHRGHVNPKSKGGSNTDLEIQSDESNFSYGDTPLN